LTLVVREVTGAVKERSMSGKGASPCSSCNGKRGVCAILNAYTRISEGCQLAIHSVELWLKGLAAAIGGATMRKTIPRPRRLSVSLINREQFFY
jgi:hypothetical protein